MISCTSSDEPSDDGNGTIMMSTQFASSGTVKSTTSFKGHSPEKALK
jgi:hypothetical protein